jgi:serine protease
MARVAPLLIVLALVLLTAIPAGGAVSASEPLVFAKRYMRTFDPETARAPADASAAATVNLVYGGGSIEKVPKIYIVYWGWHRAAPVGDIDPAHEAAYLERFMTGVGGSAWMATQAQYTETERGAPTNPTGQLKGVWYDDDQALGAQPDLNIASEAVRAAIHFGYDRDAQYIIASPHLHSDSGFLAQSYCAWHSAVSYGSGRVIAYTNLPYIPDAIGGSCGANFVNSGNAGALDGVSIVAGHEYAESVTDPVPVSGWADVNGAENADKCAWNQGPGADAANVVLPTGTFAVQTLWSNAVNGCAIN